MSVEKLSKKLAAVNGRKLFSLQVSVAQLVSIGQLYCKLVVKGTPHIHFHRSNMVHWCHTLPWNSITMSCNIQRHHCDVIYITVLYSACWNILYEIYMEGTHFWYWVCHWPHPPAHIIGFMLANMACNVYVQGSVIIHPGMHMYSCMTLTSIAVNSIHTSLPNHVHWGK